MGNTTTESYKWRKFLQPLVVGLAVFLSAASTAINKTDNDKTDSRINAIEISHENLKDRVFQTNNDISLMRETLANIRSDVTFIRLQMEANSRRK